MTFGIIVGYATLSLTLESFANALVKGVESGITDPGQLITNMAISQLLAASNDMFEAASIIKPICKEYLETTYPYAIRGVHVNYDDMVRFYTLEKRGHVVGVASMHVLAKIYESGVASYLKSVVDPC